MTFTLQELATAAGGELIGDPAQEITGAAPLVDATAGEITFFANPRYLAHLRKTRASAIFVPLDFAERMEAALIKVADPAKAFEQLVLRLAPKPIVFPQGIHPSAVVDASAKLGEHVAVQAHAVIEAGASIGAHTVVGANSYIGHEVSIGANCLIYPNVTIRERARVGARVIIHSGVVIGADGFGFESNDGKQTKVPQNGIVQIDDDVEIGANSTIDRARFGRTWIQEGAKIDNLVQIAHNVVIGKHSIIAAQTGIAGSVRIGHHVIIGGQAGMVGHIEIGNETMIGAQTGITKNIEGGIWWGTPAAPLAEAKRQVAFMRRLGKLYERVKALEKKLL